MHTHSLSVHVCMYFENELLILIVAYYGVGTLVSISHMNSFNPHNTPLFYRQGNKFREIQELASTVF